jgi:hypothetical protein
MKVFSKIGFLWMKILNAFRSAFGFPVPKKFELPQRLESQSAQKAGEKPVPAQTQPVLSPQNFYVRPNDHTTITQPVLAIDMGAAYSKVAFRRGASPGENFFLESEQLVLDGKALIPSVVIKDSDGQWHFGNIAFGLRPGPGWEVFENWKKALFDSDDPPESASIPAIRFLAWLREQVEAHIPEARQARIRIALPALDNFSQKAFLVRECFVRAGWQQDLFFPIYEPHANIIGLLVKGKNFVSWSADGIKPYLEYNKLFKSYGMLNLNQMFYFNRTRSRFLKGMILDIGAYTTDVAPLIIDLEKEMDQYGDGIEAINNFSVRYGVSSELDGPLLGELFSLVAFDRTVSKTEEIELIKEAVYAGKNYFTTSGSVEIGTPAHQKLVSHHLDRFVTELWPLISKAVADHKPEWIMLSGGGSCIKRLAEILNRRIDREGPRSTPDVDLENPGLVRGQSGTGLYPWTSTDSGLRRLATSLGATSCLLDVPYDAKALGRRNWLEETNLEQSRLKGVGRLRDCVCKGLNKTCDRCGGTGFLPSKSY